MRDDGDHKEKPGRQEEVSGDGRCRCSLPPHVMSAAAAPVKEHMISSDWGSLHPRALTLKPLSSRCKGWALIKCIYIVVGRMPAHSCTLASISTIPGALPSDSFPAGFLGKHLVQQLQDSGRYDVSVFDIRDAGISGVQTVVGDLRDQAQVEAAVAGRGHWTVQPCSD